MPSTYYKLVALSDPSWLCAEFLGGRARFGWSGPGSDLREIGQLAPESRTPDQRTTWTYTQFLVRRLSEGDRIVYQFQQPLRCFLIGEVIAPGYGFDPDSRPDFNHIVHVRALTAEPIPVGSAAVPAFLRHDLSKRGHYYRVYAEEACAALDDLLEPGLDLTEREHSHDLVDTEAAVIRRVVDEIRLRWPATAFEHFSADLFERLPGVEVSRTGDSGKGWDLLIRVRDPLSGEPLYDDVPLQCKNFSGKVETARPIEDLVRAVRNSDSRLAYLVILGVLTDEYRQRVLSAEREASDAAGHPVRFIILDEETVAQLYLSTVGTRVTLDT